MRVMIDRTENRHRSPRNFRLDRLTADDGHFECAAVATNLALDLPTLYAFICGREAQSKGLRVLLIARAGHLIRSGGRRVGRLSHQRGQGPPLRDDHIPRGHCLAMI